MAYKIAKVNTVQQDNVSILDYINNCGSAFGTMGFRNSSDAPSTDEYAVFWFGSLFRITVIAHRYSGEEIYTRAIFNNKWNNNWSSLH